MTPKIVACERSGKLICDPAAYRRDRAHGEFPLSRPDPKGARFLTLRDVRPPAWRGKDYAAELMTYGQAHRLAPGLAGATRVAVNPLRMVWVLTRYYRPPITVQNTWGGPCCNAPATVTVRSESQTDDALTGQAIDSCTNCRGIPMPIRYRSVGVTLMAPLPGYRPPVSKAEVVVLLRNSGLAGADNAGAPTVRLHTVGLSRPYPAWVITFRHTTPISYGPGQVPARPDCISMLIYDLNTRAWTDDFQSCPDRDVERRGGV
ncbi:MAG: hypothetical protein QOG85_1238 [Gaiellaceae bacterium]|jgi:hypothetical protein|nr:hypothetical protein [Gaiellaceae bacterium]